MFKRLLFIASLCCVTLTFGQQPTTHPGVLMFQLKGDIQPNHLNVAQKDLNQFSLLDSYTNYPFLKTIFQHAGVTKLDPI